jgi:polygalacturonase
VNIFLKKYSEIFERRFSMKTRTKGLLAAVLSGTMLLSLGGSALASGEASAEAVAVTGASVETDAAFFTGTATEGKVSDFTITADNEQVTGLSISGEGDVAIENGRIELVEKGTAISISGDANVTIDNVVVWNQGNADGVSAAGTSNTLVTNTVIYGAQDPETYRRASPFALGLAGSMRVTNAVENSVITYEDSLVVSGS